MIPIDLDRAINFISRISQDIVYFYASGVYIPGMELSKRFLIKDLLVLLHLPVSDAVIVSIGL